MRRDSLHQREGRKKILAMYRAGSPSGPILNEKTMTVLVADDDRTFRGTLKKVMETRRRFRIWEAGDGEAAVELSRSLQPDLIMMDLSMPRIDGLEATRIIKAEQPEVRIVVCSVHNEPVYRRAASLNGADAFVTKSRCFSELDMLESLVEEGQA
jgi:DNA-binding NarL/FixJ family response regulator